MTAPHIYVHKLSAPDWRIRLTVRAALATIDISAGLNDDSMGFLQKIPMQAFKPGSWHLQLDV
jgi:hypothetical protein